MPSPSRRRLLASLAGATLVPALARAGLAAVPPEDAAIRRVKAYLEGLTTIEARFVQDNPNGSRDRGKLYLERPDKLRLDYDPPSRLLIVARDGRLAYYDPEMNQLSYIAVEDTPVGILLAPRIDLGRAVEVTGVRTAGGEVSIGVRSRANPGQGALLLVFDENPMALRRWTVIDAQGLTTGVRLRDVRTGVALDPAIFRFRDPRLGGDNEVN